MLNKVVYEWCIETTDENGNIDSSFYEIKPLDKLEENQRLCLVRNEGNEIDGLTQRLWAYVKNEKLPEYFTDENDCIVSIKIPKRFL